MRHLHWILSLALVLGLAACSGSDKSDGSAQMADCCKKTEALKAELPKCCATPGSDCCAKKSDCCKKADEINAKMSACCKKHAGGDTQACCTPKK